MAKKLEPKVVPRKGKCRINMDVCKDPKKLIEVYEIYKLIIEGKTRTDILDIYVAKGHKQNKVTEWYREAKYRLKINIEEDIITLRSEYYSRYNDLYSKCYKKEMYIECKQILDSLTKLQGVNEELAPVNDSVIILEWQK